MFTEFTNNYITPSFASQGCKWNGYKNKFREGLTDAGVIEPEIL